MSRFSLRPLMLLIITGALAAATPPAAYDLRNVDGRQWVSTRVENQIGAGPCWAFAAICCMESNLLVQGLWRGPANDLNLSEQWLRLNEAQGYRALNEDPVIPGYARSPNSGGRVDIAIDHVARLDGPATETQVPFSYSGTINDSSASLPSG